MDIAVVRRWLDRLAIVVVIAAMVGWLPLLIDVLVKGNGTGSGTSDFWTRIYVVTYRGGFQPGGFLLVAVVVAVGVRAGAPPRRVDPLLWLTAAASVVVGVTEWLGVIGAFNAAFVTSFNDKLVAGSVTAGEAIVVTAVGAVALLVLRGSGRDDPAGRVGRVAWDRPPGPPIAEMQDHD